MEINDIIKTKSGNLYTIKRAEVLFDDGVKYLLLYDVKNYDFVIGYVDQNKTLNFINDKETTLKIARAFDKKSA